MIKAAACVVAGGSAREQALRRSAGRPEAARAQELKFHSSDVTGVIEDLDLLLKDFLEKIAKAGVGLVVDFVGVLVAHRFV
jgi:hypothetical protein